MIYKSENPLVFNIALSNRLDPLTLSRASQCICNWRKTRSTWSPDYIFSSSVRSRLWLLLSNWLLPTDFNYWLPLFVIAQKWLPIIYHYPSPPDSNPTHTTTDQSAFRTSYVSVWLIFNSHRLDVQWARRPPCLFYQFEIRVGLSGFVCVYVSKPGYVVWSVAGPVSSSGSVEFNIFREVHHLVVLWNTPTQKSTMVSSSIFSKRI